MTDDLVAAIEAGEVGDVVLDNGDTYSIHMVKDVYTAAEVSQFLVELFDRMNTTEVVVKRGEDDR